MDDAADPTVNAQNGVVVAMLTYPPRNVAAGPAPDCVTDSVGMLSVEEAKRPPWNQNGVVVA